MTSRRWILLLAAIAVVVGIARWRSEPERTEVGVTREIAGRWVTADPRWADRFLEITPGEVVFGQGEEGEARYRIVSVYRVPSSEGAPAGSSYVIRYNETSNGGPESELALWVADGALHLDNRPEVKWTPAP